uniref:Uncharacterized protein n=1 Tax=Romanomermis culicivorax TaxID=13658 RepID=A0A915L7B1_ROMCU
MNFGHGVVDHFTDYWPFLAVKGEIIGDLRIFKLDWANHAPSFKIDLYSPISSGSSACLSRKSMYAEG